MTEAPDAVVRFRGVSKTYDGQSLVVRHLDLNIERGEFLTLLGPSGSGKTTTLMMLAGFEMPTTGDIVLAGRSLANLPPHKRNIGVVFQNYALFPHMSVVENIAFPLSVRGAGRADIAAKVAHALDIVRLQGLGDRRPGQLSGGQQQRVALARALVFEPQIVLMDEPLGALDKQLREQMQLEIRHIHERLDVTIVYVTHDQAEALTMSDRIAVFHDGTIQQLDAPRALYERPANAFVARFIGENNRLSGTVERIAADDCTVRLADGSAVAARAMDVAAAGSPVTVSIRPERVVLRHAGEGAAASPSANCLRARVLEVIYLGDHVRARLALAGRDDFVAKLPIAGLDLSLAPDVELEAGWQPADCLAFRPE